MHDDDVPVGRILSRREAIALLGATSAAFLSTRAFANSRPETWDLRRGSVGTRAFQGSGCIVRPQQTEGPYFIDEKLDRSDIRSDPATGAISDGTPLALEFRIYDVRAGSCAPLSGAIVDVWQCDALGVYSDVRDMNNAFNTVGKKFLRGFQRTDAAGVAKFATIYPGWYQGRTVHIHFKVRTSAGERAREFTSQLYFDDAVSDNVFAAQPYAAKGNAGRTRNSRDGIFGSGGRELTLDVTQAARGYAATFNIGLSG